MNDVVEAKKDERPFSILALRFVLPLQVETLKALEMIRPHAEEIANGTKGEYTYYHVHHKVYQGLGTSLYLGFLVRSEEDKKKIEDEETGYFAMKEIEKEFAGYIIVNFDSTVPVAHLWQSFILPKYQNTTLMEVGLKRIEEKLGKIGVETITMSAQRDGWHSEAPKLGFSEIQSIYRKTLGGNKPVLKIT